MGPEQLTAGSATTAVRNIVLRGRMAWHIVVLFASREEELGCTSVAVGGSHCLDESHWCCIDL